MTAGSGREGGPSGGGPPRVESREAAAALLARCAAGDRGAFAALYRAVGARLFGVALRILRDEARAADVVQGAFLAIWRRAGEQRAPGRGALPPQTWMVAIVRNRALDRLRRGPGERPLEALRRDGLEPEDPQALAWVASAADGEGTRLVNCLGELDAQARRCLLGAYCEAYSRAELAEREETPLGTVNSRIRRGLMGLRRCLDESEGNGSEPWSEREQLAAEYVLGTLAASERAELEERVGSDPGLRSLVEAWQRRLAPLDEATPPVEPPPELWPRVEAALGVEKATGRHVEPNPAPQAGRELRVEAEERSAEAPARPAGGLSAGTRSVVTAGRGGQGLRRALRRQRWTSGLLGALAAVLAVLLLLGPGGLGRIELPIGAALRLVGLEEPAPERAGQRLVALLRQDPEPAALLVALDPLRGEMLARLLEPLPAVEGDYELWLDPGGDDAPRSLGLLPRDGRDLRLRLAPRLLARLGETAAVAVSLEPVGGAPGGRPSGAWVFRGPLVALPAAR